jgi:type IV pilus assembly protein PilW
MSAVHRLAPRRAAGFSLIELMVAMAIGLVLSLAVSRVLITSQESKLTTTSVNDVNQTGGYLAYVLDRMVRSAGSGYAQRRANFGCLLNASRSASTILPRATALPAPFASVSGSFRLAPVLIYRGAGQAGSDVVAVMSGTAGFGEAPLPVITGSATTTRVLLPNTVGYRSNDLVLLADDALAACMVQQISSTFAESGDQTLPLAGTYFDATGNNVNLVDFGVSGSSVAMALGRVGSPALNPPEFRLFGVGSNATLFSYDLLDIDGSDTPVPVAEGVVELRAIYGVDTDGNGTLDSWVSPGTAPYTSAALLDGSNASRLRLAGIVAVRLGMILRTNLPEKDNVGRASITLFSGLAGTVTRNFTGSELNYRYRSLEVTVPLRNMLMPVP